MNTCAKCKDECKAGSFFTEGGQTYWFCLPCSNVLNQMPTGNVEAFLGPKKKESWVAKNMREAKERRARGESLWIDQ